MKLNKSWINRTARANQQSILESGRMRVSDPFNSNDRPGVNIDHSPVEYRKVGIHGHNSSFKCVFRARQGINRHRRHLVAFLSVA
jgi:hypothetical protein